MPCKESQSEIEYYSKRAEEAAKRDGRWDILATRSQLAGWLCDAMKGEQPTPEAVQWFETHLKYNDKVDQA